MKLKVNKKAFTLIELLVVITIIGILATGATTIYTSQIQKARDSTRISDVTQLKGAFFQAFSDMGEFPSAKNADTSRDCSVDGAGAGNSDPSCLVELGYMESLPTDPKSGQVASGSILDYTYLSFENDGVTRQAYEISTAIEASATRKNKASSQGDNGDDDARLEVGNVGSNKDTSYNSTTTQASTKGCDFVLSGTDGDAVIIKNGACGG